MRNIGISIANACVVSSLLVMGSASAGNYAYECVDNYEACFPGQSLSNRCTNARGFATVLHNDGNNQLPSFENALVWNTDSIESDKFSYGQTPSGPTDRTQTCGSFLVTASARMR